MPSDTTPEAEALLLELMRRASVAEKLRIMDQLNQSLRLIALGGLRRRHPGASESRFRRLLADLVLGAELAERVYGPVLEGSDGAA